MRVLRFRLTGVDPPESLRQGKSAPRRTAPRLRDLLNNPATNSTLLLAAVAVIVVVRSVSLSSGDVLEVMQRTGVDMPQARLAVELAERTNANGQVVLEEALDKARVIKAAASTDPPLASAVTGVVLITVGSTTTAEVSPHVAGVTLQATVSGTDKYYASHALQTDSSGSASFQIPPGGPGVVDTVSVSAVLTGITAGRVFTWCEGGVPCSAP